jgi:hypothetical protein
MTIDLTKTSAFAQATDPSLMVVDMEELAQKHKEHLAQRDKLNPKMAGEGPEPPAAELRGLRNMLFCLTERKKSTETYTLNKGGELKLIEQNLNDAIARKKAATKAGNNLAERNHEHAIRSLEAELVEAKKEFGRARNVSAQAARDLKDFPHHVRIAELEKIVG